jgi:hypothetical protein
LSVVELLCCGSSHAASVPVLVGLLSVGFAFGAWSRAGLYCNYQVCRGCGFTAVLVTLCVANVLVRVGLLSVALFLSQQLGRLQLLSLLLNDAVWSFPSWCEASMQAMYKDALNHGSLTPATLPVHARFTTARKELASWLCNRAGCTTSACFGCVMNNRDHASAG